MTESALIVDDSKTASAVLKKMLERHSIDSAVVESGEDALEYLKWEEPDVIFMDHMMPGLDGFETVKAIKADNRKAHIPIIMHTTRASEGHIYIGQAKALGAVDILNKPSSEAELDDVLARLIASEKQVLPQVEVTPVYSSVIEEPVLQEPQPAIEPPLSVSAPPDQKAPRPQVSTLLLLVISVAALIYFVMVERQQWRQQNQQLLQSLEWAINQDMTYDYGELPLSGKRLQRLQGLVEHLALIGFKGKVVVEGHIGAFCLQQLTLNTGRNVLILAEAGSLLSDCHTIGLPFARSMSVGEGEAFRDFLLRSPLLNNGGIKVELVAKGDVVPMHNYPQQIEEITAGDWNVVALMNNRISFDLIPE
jgi:CheY-like chemotaxis protein